MQRSRTSSAVISAFILLPACSLIIDTNPDGIVTGVGGNPKGKGSSNAGASSAIGGSPLGSGGGTVATGGIGTLSGGRSSIGTAGEAMTSIGGVVSTGSGGLGPSGGSGTSVGVGGVAATNGGTYGNSGGVSAGGATGTSGSTSKGGAAGFGGTSWGGASLTGGGFGLGGKATGGAGASIGGAATGGVSTGGVSTGGVSTGGVSTGGVATGGTTAAATGGAINQFVSGPCVTSVDLANVEVFANGGNQKIYRRVINGSNYGSWASIAGLNAALIDIRSKLDCSSDGTTVHIAASGSNPIGGYMHATGSGTLYNQFVQELASTTFGIGVSIATTTSAGRYDMAAVNSAGLTWVDVASSSTSQLTPPLTNQLTSSPDIAIQNALNSGHFFLVAFDTSASMVFFDYAISASPASWWPAQYVSPPASTAFAYAPTLCTESVISTGNFTRHIAAVAGGKIWYAYSGTGWPTTFSAWEQISTIAANSAPDCLVTSDGTVHVVALSSTGTVVDIHGKTGSFTTTDLGGY